MIKLSTLICAFIMIVTLTACSEENSESRSEISADSIIAEDSTISSEDDLNTVNVTENENVIISVPYTDMYTKPKTEILETTEKISSQTEEKPITQPPVTTQNAPSQTEVKPITQPPVTTQKAPSLTEKKPITQSAIITEKVQVDTAVSEIKPTESEEIEENDGMTEINITIGNQVFSAKLYDNEASTALLQMMPMTLTMSELNGNEKYNYLDSSLPTSSSRPSAIQAGDLMLYGSNCLVLFYESFSTSYSYTPLGYIEDASELASVLGSESVQITFSIK